MKQSHDETHFSRINSAKLFGWVFAYNMINGVSSLNAITVDSYAAIFNCRPRTQLQLGNKAF